MISKSRQRRGMKLVQRFSPWLRASACSLALAPAGCGRAPTFNILGSFFPSWLICLVVGIILSAIFNRVFIRLSLDKEILWPVITYPCLALLFACTLWLILFS
jgi:Na+/glutamate symporter